MWSAPCADEFPECPAGVGLSPVSCGEGPDGWGLICYNICFMFWCFGLKACKTLGPQPGMESAPPVLEGDVLTTGPPGKSLEKFAFNYYNLSRTLLFRLDTLKQKLFFKFQIWNQGGISK